MQFCIVCEKDIKKNNRITHKQYNKQKFCSLSCKGKWQIKRLCGKNNPKWRGGISSLNERLRGNKKYKTWRLSVFQRDSFTCKKCNKRGGGLNAHHIESFDNNKHLIYLIDNGITFCEKCHKEFHKKCGIGNNTLEQLLSFIK